jgi:hypothetical protein
MRRPDFLSPLHQYAPLDPFPAAGSEQSPDPLLLLNPNKTAMLVDQFRFAGNRPNSVLANWDWLYLSVDLRLGSIPLTNGLVPVPAIVPRCVLLHRPRPVVPEILQPPVNLRDLHTHAVAATPVLGLRAGEFGSRDGRWPYGAVGLLGGRLLCRLEAQRVVGGCGGVAPVLAQAACHRQRVEHAIGDHGVAQERHAAHLSGDVPAEVVAAWFGQFHESVRVTATERFLDRSPSFLVAPTHRSLPASDLLMNSSILERSFAIASPIFSAMLSSACRM